MRRSHEINMTEGPILPKLIQFSLPILLMSILQNLFNTADVVIVGKFSGSDAMAAVGSTTSLVNFLVGFCFGLSIGTNILIARYYGQNNPAALSRCLHTALTLSALLSLPLAALGIALSTPLLRLINTDPEILDLAALYLRLYFLSIPADMVFQFGASALRGTGNSRLPTVYLSVAGGTNLLLNCLFVIVFGMDVDGVALATVLSKYLALFLLLRYLHRSSTVCQIRFRQLRLCREDLLPLLRLGIPSGISRTTASLSNILMQGAINSFGYLATAGNTAAVSVMAFANDALNSVSSAVTCFTSQNVGAGAYKRIPRLIVRSVSLCMGLCLCFSCAFYFFGEELLSLFVSSSDPDRDAIIANGMTRLIWVGLPIYLTGIYCALHGIPGGFGKSSVSMMISLGGNVIPRILWVSFVFPRCGTLPSIYLCYPVCVLLIDLAYVFAVTRILKPHLTKKETVT